jgi:dipeptidyl-peptidase-4
MRLKRWVVILAGLLVAVPIVGSAQQKSTFRTLDDALRAGSALSGGARPADVNWIDGGARYSYIARDPSGGQEIRALDPATGKDTLLFDAKGMRFPGTDRAFSYRSFQWAHDSRHLVFQSDFNPLYRRSGTADFYVYSLDDHSLRLAARGARTGELSPDGAMLGYERDGNMFVYSMSGRQETQLTNDATDTRYNGHFDWVYEEEFGMAQAWSWSPDSRHIAYWQVDASAEPVDQFTDFAGAHPDYTKIRIPQPGDSNPTVKIGVVDVHTGKNVWLDPGLSGDYYVPRIYWTSEPDTLAVLTLNRPQNEMRVYFFDVTTGGRRLVLTQKSDTWIDVYDFYAGVQDMISFPAGTRDFFWISDRDGWQHIYRYDYAGQLLNQVTRGRWSVTRIEGTDVKHQVLYYTSTEASPLQRQLYQVRFDGSHERRLTTDQGTHTIDMSPSTTYYIDSWSSVSTPRKVALYATGRQMIKVLGDNTRTTEWLETHAYSPTVLFTFTSSDGQKLDGSLVMPVPFDSTKQYPVVFAIYGGPGSQQVYDEFGTSGWDQWLAQRGYVVVGLNNRGSNNYGSAFEKVVYEHLGKWESHDFAEAAKYLETKRWVDPARVGIMGTSYGGYSTLYTMEMYPDVFSVGIANSAVTDWRLYDSIYTERYMGLLGDNLEGYKSSSAVENADKITGKLLVVHSMMDDNVHPRNTMQFLTALTNAGHDADVRIYPPGRHGAAYNLESYELEYHVYDRFLARQLKGAEGAGSGMN